MEKRYSQTEKEALAIVWAIEKLQIYLYGCRFKLVTNCKPVQLILSNPKSKPSARIERWNLRLQGYDFEVIHTAESRNPSDHLSRHSNLEEELRNSLAEEYVNFLSVNAVPKAITLDEIQKATTPDKTLQCVIHLMRNQGLNKLDSLPKKHSEADLSELPLFKRIKDELTVNDQSNIVLKNS